MSAATLATKRQAKSSAGTLTPAALGRATLARQLLLARAKLSPVAALEELVGLQAQLARPPYVGLWTRLAGFRREALTRAIDAREAVRATLMRCTLHLVSARDYRRFRAALQPALDKGMRSAVGARLGAVDVPAVLAASARFFGERPRTFDELRVWAAARDRTLDVRALAYAVRCSLPLVQVPVAGSGWAYPGAAAFTLAASWLGGTLDDDGAEALVLRYLAAFGPATVADAQSWSGLPALKPAFEALRPKLRTFADDRGRELFDLPKAPRPDPETPAPPRFLPEFDNLLLGHADRRRLIAEDHRAKVITANLLIPATFLVDGTAAGSWKTERKRDVATLVASPFVKLSAAARAALAAEADELLRFLEPDAARREVRFAPR
jgi:hypothetical protein